MVARINHSIQSALSFLNPLYSISTKSVTSAQFKTRFSFPQNLLLSSSKSRKSMFCTCAIADTKIHNSGQNGEAETFVLTTPLYYVNAPPHMGSAYTTIAADAITRFQRLLGKKVIFVTGTDEHGEKIAAAAVASGSSPREHCDVVSQAYKILWKDDEKELLDNNCCPMHLKPCIQRKEDNYLFALSKYQKLLEETLTESKFCAAFNSFE